MFARSLFSLAAAVALFVTAALPALAWPGGVEGRPTLTADSPVGYYVWHDENGMHVRTHGPGSEHDFVARMHTDGIFTNVDTARLESRDKIAVADGGHTLVLRFHTYNYTDGVNFRIAGGDKLHLNLELDGAPIATDSIYLGAAGVHPPSNPFTIDR